MKASRFRYVLKVVHPGTVAKTNKDNNSNDQTTTTTHDDNSRPEALELSIPDGAPENRSPGHAICEGLTSSQ